jgi:hypothetical protein
VRHSGEGEHGGHANLVATKIILFFREYNRHEPEFNCHEPEYNRQELEYNRHELEYNRHEQEYNRHEPEYNRHEPEYNRHELEYNRVSRHVGVADTLARTPLGMRQYLA